MPRQGKLNYNALHYFQLKFVYLLRKGGDNIATNIKEDDGVLNPKLNS